MSGIKCLFEWEISDGKRIKYMEKTYELPCFIQEGTRISNDILDFGQTVHGVSVNLESMQQHAYIDKYRSVEPGEMDTIVESLISDGWSVESEDSYAHM